MLSPHVPTLDSLDLLVAIGRTGSLSRAGAERGISQAAVSMRVKTVEAQVGVTLVERGPSGSRLTPAGSLLADWAGEVLAAAERLETGIEALRARRGERLRVAASLTVAEHLLPAWLTRFRSSHPGTAVSLTVVNSATVLDLVLNRQAGLGFIESPHLPAGVNARPVGSDTLVLICAPTAGLARRRRRPVTADELAALPLVEREAGSGTRAWLDAALAPAVPDLDRPLPLLEVSSTTALRAAVIAGVGPAVVSSLAVHDDIVTHRVAEVPTTGLDLRRDFRAIWPRGTTLLGPQRDLLSIVAGSPRRGTHP